VSNNISEGNNVFIINMLKLLLYVKTVQISLRFFTSLRSSLNDRHLEFNCLPVLSSDLTIHDHNYNIHNIGHGWTCDDMSSGLLKEMV
jgi:hypothetical protein